MSNPNTTLEENFILVNLATWTPWITEAILILRVVAVFKPTLYSRFSNMSALLALPVILKIVRAIILVYNLVEWRRENSITSTNFTIGPYPNEYWVLESTTILEMVDNGYISALFLWRLAVHAKAISGSVDREGPKTGIFRQSSNGNVNVESEHDPRTKYDMTSLNYVQLTTFATDFVAVILATWTPWITEAILILRVVAVFKPTLYSRFSNMAALLAFPIIIKIVRATLHIYFIVVFSRENSITSTNFNIGPSSYRDEYWVSESTATLEMFDNGLVSMVSPLVSRPLHSPYLVMYLNNTRLDRYISALFLWRLAVHAEAISGSGDRAGQRTGIFGQSSQFSYE
ncbi:hypothetical protein H0H81_009475 [Sphagnurus paluster]|uniref:Uncharacterized protein n=1 Tax=Sphagnurus paluster TaxID=117069 RepID=A0A9P7KI28_9AGAR|nr:hypothetical protein H0H81_009475 [Sphagnurus paluster]